MFPVQQSKTCGFSSIKNLNLKLEKFLFCCFGELFIIDGTTHFVMIFQA
jgi:hypothetical protein